MSEYHLRFRTIISHDICLVCFLLLCLGHGDLLAAPVILLVLVLVSCFLVFVLMPICTVRLMPLLDRKKKKKLTLKNSKVTRVCSASLLGWVTSEEVLLSGVQLYRRGQNTLKRLVAT